MSSHKHKKRRGLAGRQPTPRFWYGEGPPPPWVAKAEQEFRRCRTLGDLLDVYFVVFSYWIDERLPFTVQVLPQRRPKILLAALESWLEECSRESHVSLRVARQGDVIAVHYPEGDRVGALFPAVVIA